MTEPRVTFDDEEDTKDKEKQGCGRNTTAGAAPPPSAPVPPPPSAPVPPPPSAPVPPPPSAPVYAARAADVDVDKLKAALHRQDAAYLNRTMRLVTGDPTDAGNWGNMTGDEIAVDINRLLAGTGLVGTPLLTRDVKNKSRTPLAAACVERRLRDVTAILEKNPSERLLSLDLPDTDGRTPVVLACTVGSARIVDELLAHGADLGQADLAGRTALSVVCAQKNRDVLASILDYDHGLRATKNYVVDACKKGEPLSGVAFLLRCGAVDVDCTDDTGDRPLLAAGRGEHTEAITLLLDHGSTLGPACLDHALTHCLVSTTRALLENGVALW